jgi:alkylresorcinol/alkylpyrone synthase
VAAGYRTAHDTRFGDATATAAKIWAGSGIETRHAVADPRQDDVSQLGTAERMRRFIDAAMPLGADAVVDALKDAGLPASEVGLFAVVSCTGYTTPGLDIRLADELGMSPSVQRLHIGHMGCYAALPGLGAVSDFVTARGRPAVLLCAELTSLHVQPPTDDLQQVVAHALFSDAVAAVVVEPTAGAGWEVLATEAVTDPTTSALMTWDVTDLGFKMGLSPQVPDVLGRHARPAVQSLLSAHGLQVQDVRHWAIHPGGRRIVEVVGEPLGLAADQLAASYQVLRDAGNCSSATVLLVLERLEAEPGEYAVAMAFGPGLTLYSTLLRRR